MRQDRRQNSGQNSRQDRRDTRGATRESLESLESPQVMGTGGGKRASAERASAESARLDSRTWAWGDRCFRQGRYVLERLWRFINLWELLYYASSLSFYTIFSLVPMLCISFSILLALPGFQDKIIDIERLILSNILPTNAELALNFMHTFLENSNSLGVVGLCFIFFTSLLFFRDYEYITAKMFHSKQRNFFDSFVTYWTMVTFFPIASAAVFYFSLSAQELLAPQVFLWLATCALFLVLFRISANKPLPALSLLIASFITGSIWFLGKNAFIYYATLNVTYATLYGSLSVVLYLMVWVYVSWVWVLLCMRSYERVLQFFARDSLRDSLKDSLKACVAEGGDRHEA